MARVKKFINQLIKDNTGQSTTEYILILSVVVMIALKFKKTFSSQLDGIVGKVSGQIDQATQEQ